MNFDGFTPHEFTRFGGLVDNDDPTVLPMGVAAVCRNCRFQLTTVATRYGLQTALQGPNQAPITGLASLIYTPETVGETLFQAPLLFDSDGFVLVEQPAGSGRLVRVRVRWSTLRHKHTPPSRRRITERCLPTLTCVLHLRRSMCTVSVHRNSIPMGKSR